jgi:hypothetical protein
MFYRSIDTFSLATAEGDNSNANEYVSFEICFPYIEYVSSTFGALDILFGLVRMLVIFLLF